MSEYTDEQLRMLAARGFYGEAFPATVYAQDILDLLEGGGEDK